MRRFTSKFKRMYSDNGLLNQSLIYHLNRLKEEDCLKARSILRRRLKILRNKEYYLQMPISEIPFSKRAYNALTVEGLHTMQDLLDYGPDNLWKIRNIGNRTFVEIKNQVERILKRKSL